MEIRSTTTTGIKTGPAKTGILALTKGLLNWKALFLALAGLIAAIAAFTGSLGELKKTVTTLFHSEPNAAIQVAEAAPGSISFAGRVLDVSGKAIVGAEVLVTPDQRIGQNKRTDSFGQFQVQLPAGTKSLRIAVHAENFQEAVVEADVHRTGPEEIVMRPLTKRRPVESQRGSKGEPPPGCIAINGSTCGPDSPVTNINVNRPRQMLNIESAEWKQVLVKDPNENIYRSKAIPIPPPVSVDTLVVRARLTEKVERATFRVTCNAPCALFGFSFTGHQNLSWSPVNISENEWDVDVGFPGSLPSATEMLFLMQPYQANKSFDVKTITVQ